jgi:hypothetical protein
MKRPQKPLLRASACSIKFQRELYLMHPKMSASRDTLEPGWQPRAQLPLESDCRNQSANCISVGMWAGM